MAPETKTNQAAGFLKKQSNSGSFFFFNGLFRWLNWLLAVILLAAGATPKQAVGLSFSTIFWWRRSFLIRRYSATA